MADVLEEVLSPNVTAFFDELAKAGMAPPVGEPSGGGHAHHHDHAAHDHHAHHAAVAGSSHDAHAGHMMKMWFHGGYEEVILFDCWRIDSLCGLLVSCLVIFAMGAAYEGVKWFRVYLQMSLDAPITTKSHCNRNGKSSHNDGKSLMNHEDGHNHHNHSDSGVYLPTTTPPTARRHSNSSTARHSLCQWLQPLLYIVQLVLAYWLMLIVMTYNSWLTIAVILGAGFGHWLFAVLKYLNPKNEMGESLATDACH